MRLAILLLAVSGCARAQIGAGPLAGASRLGESSFGANAEVGGWLRGERLGIFAVAEAGGFTFGNDADGPQWLGVDARGRIVLHHAGRIRIPFVYGGGAGFEIRYLKNPLATALAEIGIEGDIGPLVLGLRARERFGFYFATTDSGGPLQWVSSTSAMIDLGYRF
ncbi:MAG TPA: hypothetical protein VIU61_00200 [Kofleriaceae bacterium]